VINNRNVGIYPKRKTVAAPRGRTGQCCGNMNYEAFSEQR